ncbi:MAG TPA: hypothetical protein PLV13_03545 [Ilumatobacteraceae bacterium]|nr:hypothetical protein [Ilumatobacteraceae bacterium]
MNRRSFLISLVGAPTLAAVVAACGKLQPDDPGAQASYDLATGPDDVILRIASDGGFTTPDMVFSRVPQLLVTGDGRVFTPGVIPEIYPGPLVMPVMVGTLTTEGLQRLAAAADDARLIGFVADYSLPDGIGIADAPDTVVTVTVAGKTYTHRAYALGIDDPTTPERERLAKFVNATADLATLVGAENVGSTTDFAPAAYRFRATPTDPTQWSDPQPTIVEWPTSTGVVLSKSAECAVVAADAIGDLFSAANQATLFQEGDVVYQVAVVVELPGDAGCSAAG